MKRNKKRPVSNVEIFQQTNLKSLEDWETKSEQKKNYKYV